MNGSKISIELVVIECTSSRYIPKPQNYCNHSSPTRRCLYDRSSEKEIEKSLCSRLEV